MGEIDELVGAIQSLYPPGEIPSSSPGASSPENPAIKNWLPPNTEPRLRQPIPDWLRIDDKSSNATEDFYRVSNNTILVIEEEIPPLEKKLPTEIDTLAYYLPFHFYATMWGIYLRASGILSIASFLADAIGREYTKWEFRNLFNTGFELLLQHERFHFITEVACSRLELIYNYEIYKYFFSNIWSSTLEEALCNAYAFRAALRRQKGIVKKQMKKWMALQWPLYESFEQYFAPAVMSRGCRLAIYSMLPHTHFSLSRIGTSIAVGQTPIAQSIQPPLGFDIISSPSDLSSHKNRTKIRIHMRSTPSIELPLEFLYDGVMATAHAPTYLVIDVPNIGILRPFPKYMGLRVLVHSNEHPPPHIHIELPPGREYTRLEWPNLKPLPGDPPLSCHEQKSLEKYLMRYRREIDKVVRNVFKSVHSSTS